MTRNELRRLGIEAARRHGLGGLALAEVRAGEEPVTECLGSAHASPSVAVTPWTVFRIASISKTLTAVGLMQLQEEGRVALDDPVNDHLKTLRVEAPAGAPEVTVRHLLTHTSGIGELPRARDLVSPRKWGVGPPGAGPPDLASLYGGSVRPEVRPGTKWAYANHGFAVLGQLVADLSGRPFADRMRSSVLDPLGMDRTDYLRSERVARELAAGYHWRLGRFRQVRDYDVLLLGAGSVMSCLLDVCRYAEWLLHGGDGPRGHVLESETLAEMMSPQFSPDPRIPGLGLAFFLDDFGGHRVAGHDGNIPGFASSLLVSPDDGVGIVALANTSTFIGAHLAAASAMRLLLGVADPAGQLPREDVPERPELWEELEGHFAPAPGFLTNMRTWQIAGGEVQVLVRRRHLVLRALSPLRALARGVRLHPVDEEDPLAFAVGIEGLPVPVVFRRDESGRASEICIGAPALAVLHRRPAWRSSRTWLRAAVAGATAATAAARTARSRHG
jgi:CubicO group peptidase (beta-lactamase class C family)